MIGVFVVISLSGRGGSLNLTGARPQELALSEFTTEVENKNVKTADWQVKKISGELQNGKKYVVQAVQSDTQIGRDLFQKLSANGVKVNIKDPPFIHSISQFLVFLIPMILIIGFFYFFLIRPAQQGGNQAMSFGRSKARRVGEQHPKVTFDDVAGIDEATSELAEIVDFLKNTKKYVALGAKIPKGILLTGPPGVGKTHLARAIAGEAGVPFFHISGSDFVEMFVGVGAARVRDLFETAKAHRPCLIFVDEIDAVGRQRGAGMGGGHDEREQTLNQLLVEMDGFDANAGVIMLAATNRPDVLDPALLRPGRFDRTVVVDPPDVVGREAILKIHAAGKPLADDVNLATMAKRTPGFTGADLANALNEAALLAARRNHEVIHMADIEEALDRVMAGPERKSRLIDDEERKVIAYHEAGHAIVGELLEECDPVHKVTILPRGMSLGSTWQIPEADSYLVGKQELTDDITALLGGRVAEELIFDDITTGAANDLQRVSAISRAMVTEYGMSDRVGLLAVGHGSRNPFLGRTYSEGREYSEQVARIVDEEVRRIVDECHTRATELLDGKLDTLHAVAEALLERETLDREEFLAVLNGEPLPPLPVAEESTNSKDESESEPEQQAEVGSQTVKPNQLEPGTA
ncbi:MAG: ATP-dependent zinc metalloprotease FtsH [Armatimonadetes bacterium]|nr:ATP-dependent zinc metalloprotease FtsH [Armatimonadota bacterium]